jgi:hypothetical protein
VAHLTPAESETMFARLGAMTPSKSSLDRLPKALSALWEADRESFEERLRGGEKVPKAAHTIAVSLDGVFVPMKDGERQEKVARTRATGRVAIIVKDEQHAERVLHDYLAYYHGRPHRGLRMQSPDGARHLPPPRPPKGTPIVATPILGGLHHRYGFAPSARAPPSVEQRAP